MVHFDVIYMYMYCIFGTVILGQHKGLNVVIYMYTSSVYKNEGLWQDIIMGHLIVTWELPLSWNISVRCTLVAA